MSTASAAADSPGHVLPDHVRAFLAAPRFAMIGTTGPDGSPHQAVAWYSLAGDGTILLNSTPSRRWSMNLARDGRVSIAIVDSENGHRWVGLNGVVEEIDRDLDHARDDIVALAHRYSDGHPDTAQIAIFRTQERVTFRIRVTRVLDNLEG